jgi:hypothetical protein
MPRIRTVTTQVEIDRGGEADGFAFGQAEFFVRCVSVSACDGWMIAWT